MRSTATVTVCTVTYGDRWSYLSRLLECLAGQPDVARVLVVDNHATRAIGPLVESWADTGIGLPVTVLTEPRNTGSAAAFGRALRHAVEHPLGGDEFIYLLDDDNLPAPDAIPRLLERSASLGPCDVVASLRTDRWYLVDAVRSGRRLRRRPNSFCGNDIVRALARRLRIAGRPAAGESGSEVGADYTPYGGMLFRRSLPERVGYPNTAYFLYADDHEYVYRIRAAGGAVRICADSHVADMEQGWFESREDGGIPPWFSPKAPELRIFYSVRNQVALERTWLVTRRLNYIAGGLLVVTLLALRAWFAGVPARLIGRRLKLLWRAARQGWTGQLGELQAGACP